MVVGRPFALMFYEARHYDSDMWRPYRITYNVDGDIEDVDVRSKAIISGTYDTWEQASMTWYTMFPDHRSSRAFIAERLGETYVPVDAERQRRQARRYKDAEDTVARLNLCRADWRSRTEKQRTQLPDFRAAVDRVAQPETFEGAWALENYSRAVTRDHRRLHELLDGVYNQTFHAAHVEETLRDIQAQVERCRALAPEFAGKAVHEVGNLDPDADTPSDGPPVYTDSDFASDPDSSM